MEFKIRRVYPYVDVDLSVNNTTISLGLHNNEERLVLAKELNAAVMDLLTREEYVELTEGY